MEERAAETSELEGAAAELRGLAVGATGAESGIFFCAVANAGWEEG